MLKEKEKNLQYQSFSSLKNTLIYTYFPNILYQIYLQSG